MNLPDQAASLLQNLNNSIPHIATIAWETVLSAQRPKGLIDFSIGIFLFIISGFLMRLIFICIKSEEGMGAAMFIFTIMLMTITLSICFSYTGIFQLWAPQYTALQDLRDL